MSYTDEEIDELLERALEGEGDDEAEPGTAMRLCEVIEQLRSEAKDSHTILMSTRLLSVEAMNELRTISGCPEDLRIHTHIKNLVDELSRRVDYASTVREQDVEIRRLRNEVDAIREKTVTRCVKILCCWCEEGHAATYDRGARVWIHLYNDEAGNATCAGTRLRTPPVEEQKP